MGRESLLVLPLLLLLVLLLVVVLLLIILEARRWRVSNHRPAAGLSRGGDAL